MSRMLEAGTKGSISDQKEPEEIEPTKTPEKEVVVITTEQLTLNNLNSIMYELTELKKSVEELRTVNIQGWNFLNKYFQQKQQG